MFPTPASTGIRYVDAPSLSPERYKKCPKYPAPISFQFDSDIYLMVRCDCPPDERDPRATVPWQEDFCENCGNPLPDAKTV